MKFILGLGDTKISGWGMLLLWLILMFNACKSTEVSTTGASQTQSPSPDSSATVPSANDSISTPTTLTWQSGAGVLPKENAHQFFQENRIMEENYRYKIPIFIVPGADPKFIQRHIYLGVSAPSPGNEPLELVLDDNQLGMPIAKRLKQLNLPAAGKAVWAYGTWGMTREGINIVGDDRLGYPFAITRLEEGDDLPGSNDEAMIYYMVE